MGLITVEELQYKHSEIDLYNFINMRILNREHAVLVGPNGSGKTTLLKLLNKDLEPDQGRVVWRNNVRVGYLDQYVTIDEGLTIEEYLYETFKDLFLLEKQMEAMYLDVTNHQEKEQEVLLLRASDLGERLVTSGFYQIKSAVGNILHGLGLTLDLMGDKIATLSGGMRAKIILTKLLLEESDILLLDEPTNFLDVKHVSWLASFLKEYDKAFLVVSHHEEFLEEIAQVVYDLDNKNIIRYKGGYQYYLEEREVRHDQHAKEYSSQQRKIAETQDFINRNLARASTTKRAQSRRKQLEKLVVIEKPIAKRTLHFEFPILSGTGNEVLTTEDLEIGYDSPLLAPITEVIRRNDKVVITGKNGVGKSTFLKTVLNVIPALSGTYKWIDTAVISYFSQDLEGDLLKTPFDVLSHKYHLITKKEIYGLLAQHGINFMLANQTLETLSGGEKTKVRLALMRYDKANILILDEPTNHLDVVAKEELTRALKEYEGTLVLVSHEQEFYQNICDYEIEFT